MKRLIWLSLCVAVVFAACGGAEEDPRVAACDAVGGQAGDLGACTIRYGASTYPVYLEDSGDLDLDLGEAPEDCTEDAVFSSRYHSDTRVCERIERSDEEALALLEKEMEDDTPQLSRSERAGELLDDAQDRFCDGRGGGAIKLAKRADRLKRTQRSRSLQRDARKLIAQQAANRRLEAQGAADNEIQIPPIVRKRCGAVNDGSEAPVGDKDCADFDSQTEAQEYFDTYGDGSGLDANEDGVACESLG